MACSLSHTIDEIQALVQKLMDEDIVRQKAIMELAMQFDNASTTKDDMRKAYEKCNDIPQESHALIDTFLKQESDKDYEMNLAIFSLQTLRMSSESDTLISNILKAAREEVIRSMDERQELINNYRAI
ncbi:hypothetical protein Tco_1166013 [Tanacetum coccineum]